MSRVAQLWPPTLHDYGFQWYLQTCSITSSKFAQWWPATASPNSLDYGFKVHLSVTRSPPPSALLNFLYHSLQLRTIMASHTISKLTWLQPLTVALIYLISASKCISKLTWLQPPSHLYVHTRMASNCVSMFTRSSSAGAPQIPLKHLLQPVQIYRV